MSKLSLSSPTMSDKTLLLSVEDLISIAMGPREGNTVNFKMIQSVLHILARQMRLLEQKVVLVTESPREKRSPSRGRSRSRVSRADQYRRPALPEFETEEQRIAWEEEQDELERRDQKRRSRSKSQFRLKSRSMYGVQDQEPGGRGRGGPRKSSVGVEPGRDPSGGRGHEERGGHGGSGGRNDSDDEERGGRDRSDGRHDRDDEEREGRGRSGGRGADRYDEEGGRRDGRREGEVKARAGSGRDAERYDEEGGGTAGGGRGGRRKGGGRDRSGGGRGADKYDEKGEGRDGGREGEVRDRAGGGRDADRQNERDGRDRSVGGRARDRYDDEDESSVRSGADTDKHGRQGSGRSVRPGGRYSEDEKTGGRGAGGRDGIDKKGLEGEDDGRMKDGGRGSADRSGRGRDDAHGGQGPGARGGRDEAVHGGKQGIGVREIEGPGKEKVLVVEKRPSTTGTARDRDGIAVVTQSQFHLLEAQVEELWRAAGPPPPLAMPDNRQLRKELAAGASLTDAMQAMQVSARVQAAEQAIMKLGGLLTQLAASGALPPDAAGAVMAAGWANEDEAQHIDESGKTTPGQASKTPGATGVTGQDSLAAGKFVTKPEMALALTKLRDEVAKALQAHIDKASTAADHAEKTAKNVGDKVEELLKMDKRLTELYSMVEDYTEQLNGFDAGLTTQMDSFKEQMATMRSDLQGGLEQLETSNSNPETAAVMELNERFEGLVRGLDDTLLQHTALSNMQHQLTQQFKTLVEDVEILRDQKADRDELLDILRDKADVSMLEGLVRLEEFERAQEDLQQRLDRCNDKFHRQDEVWMEAIRDLQQQADTKAQLTDLLKIRDEATEQLRSIDDRINRLSLVLGEPKAALLMRALARDAVCGSCLTPAMMPPGGGPRPPALPPARGPAPPPCAPEPRADDYPDFRTHRCHRWVGGSHTRLPAARAHAAPIQVTDDTTKYTGFGDDGRIYWMETQMEPCVECNVEPVPAPSVAARVGGAGAGGGDAGGAGGGDAGGAGGGYTGGAGGGYTGSDDFCEC